MSVNRTIANSFWWKWWAAFIVSAFVVMLATLPPFLPIEWRSLLMHSFSNVCHQIADRSPHIDGIALAVCHRCYGVYLGLPVAMLGFLLLIRLPAQTNTLRLILFSSLFLMMLDWGAPLIGLWHNTPLTRTITGLVFGLSAGMYLIHVIAKQGMGDSEENAAVSEHEPSPQGRS